MKIKKIKRIGIGFLSVVLLSGMAWAADTTQAAGSLAMPLMWEGGTARAMSMGSAVVGVPQGSASLFWNPAGLGLLGDCMELGLHHNSGLGDTMQESAVIGMPMGILGGFAASLNYVNNGNFPGRDSFGQPVGDYTVGDMGASLGWGKEWLPGLSAGAAIKYNRQNIASASYEAYATDLGLLWNPRSRWNPRHRLNLGLTYSNLGTKVADSVLNSGWRVGASYDVKKDLLLAVSSELKPSGFDRLQVGVESWVHPRVALRAGYVYNFTDTKLEDFAGLTAGIGIKIVKNIMFDYAYVPSGELGISQRISLTYKFACNRVQPVAKVKPVPVVVPISPWKEKLIVLEDTHFEFDSATLTKKGEQIVTENIQLLKDIPGAKVHIGGYTSCSGTTEYNQKLSEKRAQAVEAILVKEGIASERIATAGYGKTDPAMYEAVCNNVDSKEARANMRVLFEIVLK